MQEFIRQANRDEIDRNRSIMDLLGVDLQVKKRFREGMDMYGKHNQNLVEWAKKMKLEDQTDEHRKIIHNTSISKEVLEYRRFRQEKEEAIKETLETTGFPAYLVPKKEAMNQVFKATKYELDGFYQLRTDLESQ